MYTINRALKENSLRLFLLTVWIACCIDVVAQPGTESIPYSKQKWIQQLEFTAGAGYVYSAPRYPSAHIETEPKFGYTIKASGYHVISRFVALGVHLTYERKGIKQTSSQKNPPMSLTGNLTNDYFTLCMMTSFNLTKDRRLSISAGGYVSWLSASKVTYLFDSVGTQRRFYGVADHLYKSYDCGLSVSLTYLIPITPSKSLVVQLLNNNGLTDVETFNYPSIVSMSRNYVVSLLLGVRFNRGKP